MAAIFYFDKNIIYIDKNEDVLFLEKCLVDIFIKHLEVFTELMRMTWDKK